MADDKSPFAPLGDGAERVHPVQGAEPIPITPVPKDAPPPDFRHSRLGQASCVWTYTDQAGDTLGYVARFETPGDKEILPRSFCQLPDGTTGWRWKSLPAPRPLFNLRLLAARPDAPVLVVEGEKASCAGQLIFGSYVVVTWSGGGKAAALSDWTSLAGRHVTLWPDADQPGHEAMEVIARSVAPLAASVSLVQLPPDLPEGWDLADVGTSDVDVHSLLADAKPVSEEDAWPPGFRMTDGGLLWKDPEDSDAGERRVAGRFEVVAETHAGEGRDWGLLLRWADSDGRSHQEVLLRAALAGDGVDARRMLLGGGLFVSHSKRDRDRLTDFLLKVRTPKRVHVVNRMGWHGDTFVLPDFSIGLDPDKSYLIEGATKADHAFRAQGTLAEWQDEVARYAVGNSRLTFVISLSLAASCLAICGGENGGFHLIGRSSLGKTTALNVAGSALGGGGLAGYTKSWRATANGLEAVAAAHCDALLCLDELSEVAPEDAAQAAYMLANGVGKARANKDGKARGRAEWRILLLSSGEISLAHKISEIRDRRRTAGQEVRIVDLQADAGRGLGLFETVHSFPSADAFAMHLRTASSQFYGTAGPRFIEKLVGARAAMAERIKREIDDFLVPLPLEADGQVLRVARRFGLVAAAGEIGIDEGILPWPRGEARIAARRMFDDWVEARGGYEGAEIREGIERLRDFIAAHGLTRFQPAWIHNSGFRPPSQGIAGYRKEAGALWEYYLLPGTWNVLLHGLNTTAVADALVKRRLLVAPSSGRHRSRSVWVPGAGKQRVYHLAPEITQGGPE